MSEKQLGSVIKSGTNELRKVGISTLIVSLDRVENLLAIEAGMFITLPSVYRVTSGAKSQLLNRLTGGEIEIPVMCPKLDKTARAQGLYKPEEERAMLHPGGQGEIFRKARGTCRE